MGDDTLELFQKKKIPITCKATKVFLSLSYQEKSNLFHEIDKALKPHILGSCDWKGIRKNVGLSMLTQCKAHGPLGALSLLLGSKGKTLTTPVILRYLGIQALKIANLDCSIPSKYLKVSKLSFSKIPREGIIH